MALKEGYGKYYHRQKEGIFMLKVSKTFSCRITLILCYIMLTFMLALTIGLPYIWQILIAIFKSSSEHYIYSLCLLYPACILGIITCILMIKLMHKVKSEQVFTDSSVSIIRGISWCCIAVSPLFFALGFQFYIMFAAAFLTAFLGLMVRVVKNVIEEATFLKQENDLTV